MAPYGVPVNRTKLSLKKCSTPKGRQVRRLSRVEEKKEERREEGRNQRDARSCVDVFLKEDSSEHSVFKVWSMGR